MPTIGTALSRSAQRQQAALEKRNAVRHDRHHEAGRRSRSRSRPAPLSGTSAENPATGYPCASPARDPPARAWAAAPAAPQSRPPAPATRYSSATPNSRRRNQRRRPAAGQSCERSQTAPQEQRPSGEEQPETGRLQSEWSRPSQQEQRSGRTEQQRRATRSHARATGGQRRKQSARAGDRDQRTQRLRGCSLQGQPPAPTGASHRCHQRAAATRGSALHAGAPCARATRRSARPTMNTSTTPDERGHDQRRPDLDRLP